MSTDLRALCARMADELESYRTTHPLATEARAALAAEPQGEGLSAADLLPVEPPDIQTTMAMQYRSAWREGVEDAWNEARAVLARWGRPAAPQVDREVAELVQWLRQRCQLMDDRPGSEFHLFTRAADLLTRLAPQPVPVSERLPEAHRKVLAHYFNSQGKGRTICAIWVPAKSRSDSGGEEDFTEYDEETDTFYWPEGWYEVIENWDDLGYVKVYEGDVSQWQPLPQWPTLPLPISGEVQP